MPTKIKSDEKKAAADAANAARNAATVAKQAFEANPTDTNLKDTHDKAEQAARDAESKAYALSQESDTDPEKKRAVEKLKRKKYFINEQLRTLGVSDEKDDEDEDEDDTDEDEDPDRPVTFKDLQRIEARKASQTAKQMADAIEDSVARASVKAALSRVVPSGNPEQDFRDAVSIANREKNNKILEEMARRPIIVQHRSGAGAPPKQQESEFEPTAEEARFMKSFGLSKEQIIEARSKQ